MVFLRREFAQFSWMIHILIMWLKKKRSYNGGMVKNDKCPPWSYWLVVNDLLRWCCLGLVFMDGWCPLLVSIQCLVQDHSIPTYSFWFSITTCPPNQAILELPFRMTRMHFMTWHHSQQDDLICLFQISYNSLTTWVVLKTGNKQPSPVLVVFLTDPSSPTQTWT